MIKKQDNKGIVYQFKTLVASRSIAETWTGDVWIFISEVDTRIWRVTDDNAPHLVRVHVAWPSTKVTKH